MNEMLIGGRKVGKGHPCFIVAELSANHNGSYEKAERLVRLAKEAGADAVKLQTYTPDTMTLDCDNECFRITEGPWAGQTLYQLYQKAATPWEWHPRLKQCADAIGITLFSTPFDKTAVDFLETMDVPAYKIASFELVDLPLIRYTARKKKPLIVATGMGTREEIEQAVQTIRGEGNNQIILLKCTSDYPARPKEMNLATIADLASTWNVPAGLSDHSRYNDVAVAAVCWGACVIEKHFTESRADGGPDGHFSMEPEELKALVESVRRVEAARGEISYGRTASEEKSVVFRRSLFAARTIAKGERFTEENVRCIRPGHGLAPREIGRVLQSRALRDCARGEPLGALDLEPRA